MTTAAKAMKPTAPITTGGWARLILYGIAVLTGLGSVLAAPLGFGHLTELLASISGTLLVVTGGTAALNLGKADDQKFSLRELGPAVLNLITEVRDLRQQAATPAEVADELERRQPAPAPQPTPDPSPTPVPTTGNALLDKMREQIASNRKG